MSEHETTLRQVAEDILRTVYSSRYSDEQLRAQSAACLAGADALQRETRCCGNCKHADTENSSRDAWCHCAAPMGDTTRWPFRYCLMPLDQRCTGWEAHEAAQ